MNKLYITRNPSLPFSDAVLVDDKNLYISGRIGLLKGVITVPESSEDEARLLLEECTGKCMQDPA